MGHVGMGGAAPAMSPWAWVGDKGGRGQRSLFTINGSPKCPDPHEKRLLISARDRNHELSRQEWLKWGGRVGRAGHQHGESWQSMGELGMGRRAQGAGHGEQGMVHREREAGHGRLDLDKAVPP